jgi:hypothetical protein
MTRRREFSRKVYAEIVKRAFHPKLGFICEGCGFVLGKRKFHVDHTIPDALQVDKSVPLTADDGKLLGVDCCHAPKTKVDVKNIAKAKRNERNYLGMKQKSRGFQKPANSKFNWSTGRYEKTGEA